jgi:hypothetical protein
MLDMLRDSITAQRQPSPVIKAVTVTKRYRRSWVLEFIAVDEWRHRSEIKEASGRKQSCVDMGLFYKRPGLPESNGKGLWRKTPAGAL